MVPKYQRCLRVILTISAKWEGPASEAARVAWLQHRSRGVGMVKISRSLGHFWTKIKRAEVTTTTQQNGRMAWELKKRTFLTRREKFDGFVPRRRCLLPRWQRNLRGVKELHDRWKQQVQVVIQVGAEQLDGSQQLQKGAQAR